MTKPLPRSVPSRAAKAGMPPGSLVHVGTPKSNNSVVHVSLFSSSEVSSRRSVSISEAISLRSPDKNLWINIDGLGDLDVLKQIGDAFSIHPLVLEDISNPDQRPKAEHYEHYSFFVLRAYTLHSPGLVDSEQVSIILGKDFLITIQEKEGDAFEQISEKLNSPDFRSRIGTLDYLAYSVLDCIVDGYFSVLESFGAKLEKLENQIIESPVQRTLAHLYAHKRTALQLRRSIWPMRELLVNLDRSDSKFITAPTKIYLRDVYSHVIELIDTIEIYREMLTGLLDIYLSSSSNRLNEVMKVLTVITTIFMPLSFLAGIYGMNFGNMPELKSTYGYPIVLSIMGLIGGVMFLVFRRKRWI